MARKVVEKVIKAVKEAIAPKKEIKTLTKKERMAKAHGFAK